MYRELGRHETARLKFQIPSSALDVGGGDGINAGVGLADTTVLGLPGQPSTAISYQRLDLRSSPLFSATKERWELV